MKPPRLSVNITSAIIITHNVKIRIVTKVRPLDDFGSGFTNGS